LQGLIDIEILREEMRRVVRGRQLLMQAMHDQDDRTPELVVRRL